MASITLAEAVVEILGDDTGLQNTINDAARSMRRVGDDLARVGRTLTTRVTVPLLAIGGAAVKMAVDAEESANKFEVVFRGSTESVRAQLEELQEVFPATTGELEGMAASLQDLLIPFGIARAKASQMSVDIIELAGDISSFNNVATPDVLNAFRSALAGQSEPLLRFGIDTRAASLETIALREELIEAGEALTSTARAQAVLIAATEDSSDALGDLRRTVDSTSNQTRLLFRDLRQLAEDIGRLLIPAVRPLIASLRELTGDLGDLDESGQATAATIALFAAAAGPLALLASGALRTAAALVTLRISLLAVGGVVGIVTLGLGFLFQRFIEDSLEARTRAQEFNRELERMQQESAEARELADELAEALTQVGTPQFEVFTAERELERARRRFEAFRNEVRASGEVTDEQRQKLNRLFVDVSAGITRVDEAKAALAEFNEEVRAQEVAQASAEIREVLSELDQELQRISAREVVFGEEFDAATATADALRDAINGLIDLGVDPLNQRIRDLQTLLGTLPDSVRNLERINAALALVERGPTAQLAGESVRRITDSLVLARDAVAIFSDEYEDALREIGRETLELQRLSESAIRQISSAFADFVLSADTSFSDFVDNVLRGIARMIIEFLAFKALTAAFGGPTGAISSIFGAILPFQEGGFLPPGRVGLVGEDGRELITAGPRGATITPIDAGAMNVNLGFNLQADTPARIEARMFELLRTGEFRRRLDEAFGRQNESREFNRGNANANLRG